MRYLLLGLLLLVCVPARAAEGWTLNSGFSDVDDYGLGVDIGLGYFWKYGNWTTRFNFAAGTAVEEENERYATRTRFIFLIAESYCVDTETGNEVNESKCDDSQLLYSPSLELAYAVGESTSLGIAYRGVENESAYAFLENRFGNESEWYLQIKLGNKYSGINFGWDFGVTP